MASEDSSQDKRKEHLEWEEYFMASAFLAAKRSKDPCTQVGACIVNDENKIVGIGYNGLPIGCDDNKYPWGKRPKLENKHFYECHAEMNAIVLNKNSMDMKNCKLYVGPFPCNECAKVIIQSGIKEVIYVSDKKKHKDEVKASKRMLTDAKVAYRAYEPKNKTITINFDEMDEIDQKIKKEISDQIIKLE